MAELPKDVESPRETVSAEAVDETVSPASKSKESSPNHKTSVSPSSTSPTLSPRDGIGSDDESKGKSNKLKKFFGEESDVMHPGANFAAQPAHVTHIRIKKKFGEDVDLGHDGATQNETETSSESPSVEEKQPHFGQTRRVQKFFGENFDVKMTEMAEKTSVGLRRELSHDLQPAHVDAAKLNKFFGRHTPVQHRDEDSSALDSVAESDAADGAEADDAEYDDAIDKKNERSAYKSNQKLREFFGTPVDLAKDKEAKQFASQPEHVKQYKLKKHFGDSVVVEHNDRHHESAEESSEAEPKPVDPATVDHAKQRKLDTFFGARVESASLASLSDAMSSTSIGSSALRLSGTMLVGSKSKDKLNKE